MQKCKNEKHASLVKSHTVKRMFWKMQNFSLGGSLTILQSENIFFRRSENTAWTQFFFKQRHLAIRDLRQWFQLTHAIIPQCGEAMETLWNGFFAKKTKKFNKLSKLLKYFCQLDFLQFSFTGSQNLSQKDRWSPWHISRVHRVWNRKKYDLWF